MNYDGSTEPVIALCDGVVRLHHQMNDAYDGLAKALRECPGNDQALSRAQLRADVLGRKYERLCDRICRAEATSLKGLLAKLQCATRCIRDTVPEGTDPEQACDIELRFVFAVERDVQRLIADARRGKGSRRPNVAPRSRETTSSAIAKPSRDVGIGGAGHPR